MDETRITEIKVALLRQGLTQRELAKKLDISITYLYDIFRMQRPAKKIRRRLMEEFKLPAELVAWPEAPKSRAA